MKSKKLAVLSLSGGLDSSSLAANLLAEGFEVVAVSFDYGQKHKVEIERASSLVELLSTVGDISHSIIKLDGLSQLLSSSLVEGGDDVPEGHYQDSNMKQTVVPNRNKIFSSIIQAVALSLSQQNDECEVRIGMGIHSGDHDIYPDCREEFRDTDYQAFRLGNWGAGRVILYTPYLSMSKGEVLCDGIESCETLGVDYCDVYSRTITSYKPFKVDGVYVSDYKSASSVERIEAFMENGVADPITYGDESGVVTWEKVKLYVETVLSDNSK